MSDGGGVVAWQVERSADCAQAEVFHALLAEKRAELCDLLDEHAVKLARYARRGHIIKIRRKMQRIKDTGAEIRDIDRMLHSLQVRLQHEQRHV